MKHMVDCIYNVEYFRLIIIILHSTICHNQTVQFILVYFGPKKKWNEMLIMVLSSKSYHILIDSCSRDSVPKRMPTEKMHLLIHFGCLQITRSRNKWKFYLKDGIMNIGGKDYIFQKSNGDAEWWMSVLNINRIEAIQSISNQHTLTTTKLFKINRNQLLEQFIQSTLNALKNFVDNRFSIVDCEIHSISTNICYFSCLYKNS